MTLIAVFIMLVFVISLVSERLRRTIVTAPIVFTVAGMVAFLSLPTLGLGPDQLDVFLRVAEVGLVLLLFTDASRTDLGELRDIRALPIRLLSVGMLLTIVLGALARWAWLSIGAALATISLKVATFLISGSVGLLSDAAESGFNLAGAVMALAMLTVAARPPDQRHAFGHSKAKFFASGVEGLLILVAAAGIVTMALQRLASPRALELVGPGLTVSIVASLINLVVGLALIRVGKRWNSITLEADGQHLLTDVWTSAGVIVGVGVTALSGWHALDPIVALAVAANIVWTGVRRVRRSVAGLMDASLPESEPAVTATMLASSSLVPTSIASS